MLNLLAINLLKLHEGLRLKPYKDVTGTPTIGYGNTFYEDGRKVTLQDAPITEQRAIELFTKVSNAFAKSVKALISTDINDNQLGALTSFAYNVGIGNFKKSNLLKKVNSDPNDETIEQEFAKWNKSKGIVLNGLIKRRSAEYALYKKKTNSKTTFNMKQFFITHKKKILIGLGVVLSLVAGVILYKKYAKR